MVAVGASSVVRHQMPSKFICSKARPRPHESSFMVDVVPYCFKEDTADAARTVYHSQPGRFIAVRCDEWKAGSGLGDEIECQFIAMQDQPQGPPSHDLLSAIKREDAADLKEFEQLLHIVGATADADADRLVVRSRRDTTHLPGCYRRSVVRTREFERHWKQEKLPLFP